MRRNQEIVFVHLLNDYSGSPRVLSNVVEAVKQKKESVKLYTGNRGDGFLSGMVKDHRHYFYTRGRNVYFTLFSFLFSQLVLFIRLMRFNGRDCIIYVNTMLPFGAGLAGFILRKPVYYHIHEISLSPKLLKKFLRGIIKLSASKIIYVSEAVKREEHIMGKQEYVVYNSLSETFLKRSLNHPYNHTQKGKFVVLMVASLKEYKGINEFIMIANLLTKNENIQFNLVLNAEITEVESYRLNKSISKQVYFFSKQSNVASFYEKASLVLNLSRPHEWVETFGLTIVEAMSYGIPVIVPPVGGPAEIVKNGEEGYLISSSYVDKIAMKIEGLSKEKDLCMKLSAKARKRAKDFDPKIFNKEIRELLDA